MHSPPPQPSSSDFILHIEGPTSVKVGTGPDTYTVVIDDWGEGSQLGDFGGGKGIKWSNNYLENTTMYATTKTSVQRPYRNTSAVPWSADDQPKYKLRVEVINDAGQVATAELDIDVLNQDPFRIRIDGPDRVRVGDPANQFTVVVESWGEGTDFGTFTSVGGLKWSLNYNESTTMYETTKTTVTRPYNRSWESKDMPSYKLRVEAINNAGQTTYAEKIITVEGGTDKPIAIITSDAEESDEKVWVYSGDSVVLSGSNSYDPDGGPIVKYDWIKPGINYGENVTYVGKQIDNPTPSNYKIEDVVQLKVTDDEAQESDWTQKTVVSWKFYPMFTDVNQRIQETINGDVVFTGACGSQPADRIVRREWTVLPSWGWDENSLNELPVLTPYGDKDKYYSVTVKQGNTGAFVIVLRVYDKDGHMAQASERFFALNHFYEYDNEFTKYRKYKSYDEEVTPENASDKIPDFQPTYVRNELISKIQYDPNQWYPIRGIFD